ncbi:MAG TPA: hypothetical protein VFP12_14580, partial [Allosphingosinicella sp.]|nr:hypothetical protein [Allosphingosinicella sp.]
RTYLGSRDGDYRLWEARQAERIAIAREAQQAWEEKARAEAQAWAKREAGGKAGEGEGDESPPGA